MVLVLVVDMLSSCMALACSSKQIVYLRYKSRERQKPRKRRLQSGGLKGKKKPRQLNSCFILFLICVS